jgi:hypothetical protein
VRSLRITARKVHPDPASVSAGFLKAGVRCLPRKAELLVLAFDATDDPLHGRQEGRFFHGCYDADCDLPLFCLCGDVPLWAQLRTANRDASDGTLEALLGPALAAARAQYCLCGGASVRSFAELTYSTQESWSRERRVLGKAEVSAQGEGAPQAAPWRGPPWARSGCGL